MRAKAHLVGVAGLEAGVAKASELAQRARIGALVAIVAMTYDIVKCIL